MIVGKNYILWLEEQCSLPNANIRWYSECRRGEQQCVHRQVALPHGTEVDMMGVDRLPQLMTAEGDRAGSRWKLPALLYSYNGLYSIYIYIYIIYHLSERYSPNH